MKQKNLSLCDTIIHPGETANLAMPFPHLYACAPLYMPIKVMHGKKPGPCLVLLSVFKGNELNGLEIVNQVMANLNIDEVCGTVIAIPVVNIYGLTHYPSVLPNGSNLANCFPGNPDGTFGERIAHLLTQEILKRADYCIELSTGEMNHNLLPHTYCSFERPETKRLAEAFQTPVVTDVALKGNALRRLTEELQIPFLVYQAGEAMRFDDNVISLGVKGVQNVMQAIDMLPKMPTKPMRPIFSRDEEWITAHTGGVLHPYVSLGQSITTGDALGKINDPFSFDQGQVVVSPTEGVVVGINTTPFIHEGLAIFKIASFADDTKAESVIEKWDRKQPDSYING